MAEIILDIGSGNTCKNSIDYAKRMIDEVIKVDTKKHKVIFKAQLFTDRPPNVPLKRRVFNELYEHCKDRGYDLTASVFDLESLKFLLKYNPVFVKIANDRSLDWLIGEVPRKHEVYKSVGDLEEYFDNGHSLFCVSKYPAHINDYPSHVGYISDHTEGFELFKRNKPDIWEKHLKLPDSTGLDAGPFAITPEELAEVL